MEPPGFAMVRYFWTLVAVAATVAAHSPAQAQFGGGGGMPDAVMQSLSEPERPGRETTPAAPPKAELPRSLAGRIVFEDHSISYTTDVRIEITSVSPFRGRMLAPEPRRIGSDRDFALAAVRPSRWYPLQDGRFEDGTLVFELPYEFWSAGASAELERSGDGWRGTFTFKTPTITVQFDADGKISLHPTAEPAPAPATGPIMIAKAAPKPAVKQAPQPATPPSARRPVISWNAPREPATPHVAAALPPRPKPKPAPPRARSRRPSPRCQSPRRPRSRRRRSRRPSPCWPCRPRPSLRRPQPAPQLASLPPPAPAPAPQVASRAQPSSSPFFVPAIDGHRLALVIGNSSYKTGRLDNPVNDARLVAGALRKAQFEVIEVLDASQRQMKRAIQKFGERLDTYGKHGVALFYYAGHGVQAGGRNFLVPVDAVIRRETDLDIEGVPADWVVEQLEFAKSALNLIILDACRNNPFSHGFRSLQSGLARMNAPTGTLIAYSTAPGDVAADGDGANSPYSKALARAILVPGAPVEQAFKEVRVAVRSATKGAQTPWEASSLTGDFYFVPPTTEGRVSR